MTEPASQSPIDAHASDAPATDAIDPSTATDASSQNFPQLPVSDNSIKNDLTDRQRTAIDLLLTGSTDTAVAAALGLARRTIYDWKKHNPLFRAALADRREDLLDQSSDRFRALLNSSLDVLERQLNDTWNPTSFRAAKTILTLAQLSKCLHPKTPTSNLKPLTSNPPPNPEP